MKPLIALLAGMLFGLGLAVSNMLSPARVIGFLDLFGRWDPTLALVMGGAVLVTLPGFAWAQRRTKPWFDPQFSWPERADIDMPLVAGALLFGLGWGLAGLCPGPAIAALLSGSAQLLAFVAIMIGSWWAADRLLAPRP